MGKYLECSDWYLHLRVHSTVPRVHMQRVSYGKNQFVSFLLLPKCPITQILVPHSFELKTLSLPRRKTANFKSATTLIQSLRLRKPQ